MGEGEVSHREAELILHEGASENLDISEKTF